MSDPTVHVIDDDDAARDSLALERLAGLAAQEQRVRQGLIDGCPNKIIAFDLGISAHMAEIHRASLMTKMQPTSLSQLVRMVLLANP